MKDRHDDGRGHAVGFFDLGVGEVLTMLAVAGGIAFGVRALIRSWRGSRA
jgi:hypothetical protein